MRKMLLAVLSRVLQSPAAAAAAAAKKPVSLVISCAAATLEADGPSGRCRAPLCIGAGQGPGSGRPVLALPLVGVRCGSCWGTTRTGHGR